MTIHVIRLGHVLGLCLFKCVNSVENREYQLPEHLCFFMKGTLFVTCAPGKVSVTSHSTARGPQRAALLLVARIFFSPAALPTQLLYPLYSSSYSSFPLLYITEL